MEKEQTTTLFVHNIPTRMHWKGLWHAFGKHGDVVDAFIARKMSRVGKRFGFVRFARRSDADRAMGRLNGFSLYGFRIFVAFAKFNGRSEYWRKQNYGEEEEKNLGTCRGRRAVETTTTVCSVKSIVDRLLSWGLGEIKIQRLGAVKETAASWVDVVSRCQKGEVEPSSVVSHRAEDNSRCLGLLSDVSEGLISKESTKKTSSWAASVDALNNALNNNYDNLDSVVPINQKDFGVSVVEDEVAVSRGFLSEEEGDKTFFPELAPVISKRKGKKYASLLDFQDKVLTELERKKRDRAIKRNKAKKKELECSELFGRSLSDSDLAAKWILATREARKALKLGKKIGFHI
ncbi:hypothetical protein GQ457_15G029340 [Hibiscus cannabinus]